MVAKTGFIGLGSMGKPLAMNVLKGGFDLMVYDLRKEPLKEFAAAGAKIGRSAREVGAHAGVIEVTVVDDAQAEAVILGEEGVLDGANAGSVIAIHSTIHPNTVKKIAERAGSKGVKVIDAQVSGGGRGAEAQRISFMVGGDKESLEKCRPVFECSGKNIFHMGKLGMGAMAKLSHQVIVVGTMMAVAEGMILAEKGGLDIKAFEKVVHFGGASSYIADSWLGWFKLLDKGGADILYKCLIPALDLAHQLNLSLPLTTVAQQLVHVRIDGERTPPTV
jgi:2-hydroxy-3-oxopropionate reductase